MIAASLPAPSACILPKRLHVITWGCQMNVYDSARMTDVLRPLGYAPAESAETADMVSSTPAISATAPPRRCSPSLAACA